MTISPNPELTNRDDHHQPFFDDDQFLPHGVHSVKHTTADFDTVARDGWRYNSAQMKTLQQKHGLDSLVAIYFKKSHPLMVSDHP